MLFSIMFHHFHNDKNHPQSQGSISAKDLACLIEFLQSRFNLLNADEYSHKVLNDGLDQHDVCLSFDDALKSQYDIAAPVLNDAGLKAYFFVYSGAFGAFPPLHEFSRDFRNSFPSLDAYYQEFFNTAADQFLAAFNTFLDSYPENYLKDFPFYTQNDRKYRFLRDRILKDNYASCVLAMMEKHGYCREKNLARLFLSPQDLKNLHQAGHVIGLHSTNHPTAIHTFSYREQEKEYQENMDFLQQTLAVKINAMSHPCGNYNEDTLTILKKMGIKIGFRSSLSRDYIRSSLEIPREDHTNLLKTVLQ